MRRLPILLTLTSLTILTTLSPAIESRVTIEHRNGGAVFIEEIRNSESVNPAVSDTGSRDDILWHYYQAPTYSSTALGNLSGVFSGAYDGMDMHALAGDGTPLWSSTSGQAQGTAGAAAADRFASVIVNESINGVTIQAWTRDSSTAIWSKDVPDCSAPYECLRLTDDGSILVIGLNMALAGNTPRVYTLDAATGDLVSTFDGGVNTYIRALEISDDGTLAAIRASSVLYVIETDTGTQRWTASAGASADGLAFSGDGSTIASGWTFLLVWKWNGSTYNFAWSHNGGGTGWYLGHCGLSADGGALVAGFYTTSYNQLRVLWFDTESSTPLWTYDSPFSSGVYQEIPSGVAVAPNGQFAVVGSWGDSEGLNPELHVFGPTDFDPLYTVNSPGSIFSVDIAADSGGIIATGAGKHVHANEFGSGGDLYVFEVGPPTQVPDESAAERIALKAYPNPFNPMVTLEFWLPEADRGLLEIFSPEGRFIARAAGGEFSAGSSIFTWNGRDAGGRQLPSGVYLARLKTSRAKAIQRLVMLR